MVAELQISKGLCDEMCSPNDLYLLSGFFLLFPDLFPGAPQSHSFIASSKSLGVNYNQLKDDNADSKICFIKGLLPISFVVTSAVDLCCSFGK